MVVDLHVHISALSPANGGMSQHLLSSIPFRFIKWRLGLRGQDERTEARLRQVLFDTLDDTPELDAAVILAFDAPHEMHGHFDTGNTHLYTKNRYVIELCSQHPKALFGASIHPYRRDAVAELERCVAAGAVLVKWLPITQGMDPSHEKCRPFYEAMAGLKIPLLAHTGGEKSLPNVAEHLAAPRLLELPLKCGVTVIAAHCGTRSTFTETDYVDEFVRMCYEHERFFGDTAALNLPTRSHAYRRIIQDDRVRSRLVHGSDWPIPVIPPAAVMGMASAAETWFERNWLRRDVKIKQALGLDDDYWRRGASLLRQRPAG